MLENRVFALTDLGHAELDKLDGNISGNEKRLMQLLDGNSSLDEVKKLAPAAVRYDLERLLNCLLDKRFIIESQQISSPHVLPITDLKNGGVPPAIKPLYMEMRLLAEIEGKRRLAAERELEQVTLQLAETRNRLQALTDKYQHLTSRIQLYKCSIEKKFAEQNAQIAAISGVSQDDRAERVKLESELGRLRVELEIKQDMMDKITTEMDETVHQKLVVAQSIENQKRKQIKIEAENRVRTHPQYARIRGLDFFKKFRNSDLDALLSWAEWLNVKAGETVISEGELGLPFYVVVSGRLAVVKKRRTLSVLKAGNSFGEIAYLDDENPQRDVSVVAQTDCELLKLEPSHLENAELMLRMHIAEALVRVQAQRLRRTVDTVVRMLD
ncbi:MAG: cyclic nucleotide-binding domain-containing protein [Gallionella sp.]|nr:cyclic nucleotide-binding domain-containing protein [Gallionella sp.]